MLKVCVLYYLIIHNIHDNQPVLYSLLYKLMGFLLVSVLGLFNKTLLTLTKNINICSPKTQRKNEEILHHEPGSEI